MSQGVDTRLCLPKTAWPPTLKNKEKDKLSVIRMIKASLQNEAIKLGTKELSEEEELTILSRESKQRKSDRSHVVL